MNIGWQEIVIIVAVVVVLFLIPKKLPQLGSSLGKSVRGFKKGIKEGKDELKSTVAEVRDAAGLDVSRRSWPKSARPLGWTRSSLRLKRSASL